MSEEKENLFDAVRKANRMVWEQASGRNNQKVSSDPFDEIRKSNRETFKKASGRADFAKPNEVKQPTFRETDLDGKDYSSMISTLSSQLAVLQARVDYIEDDFPEQNIGDMGGGVGGSNIVASLSIVGAFYTALLTLYAKITPGFWTHGYSSNGVSGTIEDDGTIYVQLNPAIDTQYIYVQRGADNSVELGVSADYPESSTQYLRRSIGMVQQLGTLPDGSRSLKITNMNFGDIYTW